MSLVPLADIFNHKAAIVQLSGEYMIEPVCFEGGKESSDDDASSADCGEAQCPDPGCSGESRSGLTIEDEFTPEMEPNLNGVNGQSCSDSLLCHLGAAAYRQTISTQVQPSASKWGLRHAGQHGKHPTTRGSLLQSLHSSLGQEHKLEIGICGATGDDGEELLQVQCALIALLALRRE